jgi:uncharacterized membrane protein
VRITNYRLRNTIMAKNGNNGWTNVGNIERIATAIGGGLLIVYGAKRRTPAGIGAALAGAGLALRSATGHCPGYAAMGLSSAESDRKLHLEKAVTIYRTADELYGYWRQFEDLPTFMEHLQSVVSLGEDRWHWVTNGPAGRVVEWDAEVTEDQPGRLIAWRSLPGSEVETSGVVRFEAAPGGRGTVVHVTMDYTPPAGLLGAVVAKVFGEDPERQVEEDLRHFKQIMEAGEIPTTEGQPSGKSGKRTLKSLMISSAKSAATDAPSEEKPKRAGKQVRTRTAKAA